MTRTRLAHAHADEDAPQTLPRPQRSALVAGDSVAAVASTVALLEELGVSARSAESILDILKQASSRWPVDLLVFDLACDAWIYVALLEVLVRERRRLIDTSGNRQPWEGIARPLVLVISDQNQALLDRLRGLDLPLLVRPFNRAALESALSVLPEKGFSGRQRVEGA